MQLVEVQFVHWASIRTDPIPLALGVNQAVGPNGAGKTAFLDGVKLLYGIDEFGAQHSLREYVFDGGPVIEGEDPPVAAEVAYVRGTFRNTRVRGGHRVFAAFGSGCEHAEFVTVVCAARRVGLPVRDYLVLAGWDRLGLSRSVEADLRRWTEQPRRRWIGSDSYHDRLEAIGISRTHRRILALPQGETAKFLADPPERLFVRVLELTGKQAVLDEFRTAADAYDRARARFGEARRQLELSEARLVTLGLQVQRHEEFLAAKQELARVREVLLQAARYQALDAKVQTDSQALKGVEERLGQVNADRGRIAANAPRLARRIGRLQARIAAVATRVDEADKRARATTLELGGLQRDHRRVKGEAYDAQRVAQGRTPQHWADELERARQEHADADQSRRQTAELAQRLEREAEQLRDGRLVLAAELLSFSAELEARGITTVVAAQTLDLPSEATSRAAQLAETALGEGLWTLVVEDPGRFDEAVALAAKAKYRLPLARAGPGRPGGVLAALTAPDRLGAMLEEFDADPPGGVPPNGRAQVTGAGIRRSRVVARLTAPDRPVLGHRARAARLAEVERTLEDLHAMLPELEEHANAAADRLRAAEAGHNAALTLPDLRAAVEQLEGQIADLEPVEDAQRGQHRRLTDWQSSLQVRAELLGRQAESEQQQDKPLASLELQLQRQVEVARPALERLRAELAAVTLTAAQQAAFREGVDSVEVLERRDRRLGEELDDRGRYPDEVRDVLVVAQRDEAEAGVAEARRLLDAKYGADVEAQRRLLEEAKSSYNSNVVSTIGLVNDRFRELCAQAGMEGVVRRIQLEGRSGLEGLDVAVSHRPGERPRSYRDTAHSGGQRVKMAVLLLLATLQSSGTADFLILDEPTAHLDETNIGMVGQLMRSLSGQVQFLLATPTRGDEQRLAAWSDLIIGFVPRATRALYSPPVQLLVSEHAHFERPSELPFAPPSVA